MVEQEFHGISLIVFYSLPFAYLHQTFSAFIKNWDGEVNIKTKGRKKLVLVVD